MSTEESTRRLPIETEAGWWEAATVNSAPVRRRPLVVRLMDLKKKQTTSTCYYLRVQTVSSSRHHGQLGRVTVRSSEKLSCRCCWNRTDVVCPWLGSTRAVLPVHSPTWMTVPPLNTSRHSLSHGIPPGRTCRGAVAVATTYGLLNSMRNPNK
eukprot:5860307-Pyramimonas_sp.AAC.2